MMNDEIHQLLKNAYPDFSEEELAQTCSIALMSSRSRFHPCGASAGYRAADRSIHDNDQQRTVCEIPASSQVDALRASASIFLQLARECPRVGKLLETAFCHFFDGGESTNGLSKTISTVNRERNDGRGGLCYRAWAGLKEVLCDIERRILEEAWKQQGSQARAAKVLGLGSQQAFCKRLRLSGLTNGHTKRNINIKVEENDTYL